MHVLWSLKFLTITGIFISQHMLEKSFLRNRQAATWGNKKSNHALQNDNACDRTDCECVLFGCVHLEVRASTEACRIHEWKTKLWAVSQALSKIFTCICFCITRLSTFNILRKKMERKIMRTSNYLHVWTVIWHSAHCVSTIFLDCFLNTQENSGITSLFRM